ncbi:MAG: type II toxin-antitoxin system HipA family toxin [Kiritimatiellae bacterium]|nr:type II toxin-antitoxin system HipA family toxin [Kiritimatiellia bacterium]
MQVAVKRSLGVLWNGRSVGRYDLLEDASELFTYDPDYLASADAAPISHSLPLRADPYGKRQLRPFFAGLLPEESQRQRIAAVLGLSESDDFALLEAIGGECAGALTILPQGMTPRDGPESLDPCPEDRLAEIVRALPYRPMLAGEKGLRLSLAGAQSKLPIVFKDGAFWLPKDGTPSTHILKPELSEWFKGIVHNEHACMTLARILGIPVAETGLAEVGGIPCLVVRRYDRATDAATGRVRRIHQEDFCQALGRPPEQKYQSDGGPLAREIVRLLRSGWSTSPARDILAFVDLVVFNAIIGNADAHGKNYSMLYDGRTRRLAPGYDLVSTVFWPELAAVPAMKIGGSDSIHSILAGHWRKFAQEIGVGAAGLRVRIKELCEKILATTRESLSLPETCDAVIALVQTRAQRMLARME